jgi:hypothetical protein
MNKLLAVPALALAALGLTAASASAAVPTPAPTPTAPHATACHPLTSGGKCYEPGEFCPVKDYDATGLAGDGKAVVCWNNDGWRWEPSPEVTLSCSIVGGGPTALVFDVSVTSKEAAAQYVGTLSVSFRDYPGSRHIFPAARVFPDRYVTRTRPYTVRVEVPMADIGASARPSGCSLAV